MAEQPLAGVPAFNVVGKHRKIVVKRPNGEVKVLENANAMPDGIIGRAPVFMYIIIIIILILAPSYHYH